MLSFGSEAIRIQPTRVGMRHYQKEHVASISRNPDGSVVKDNILDKFLLPTLIDVGSFESRQKMTDHETQRLAKAYEITEALSKLALTAQNAGPANSPGSKDPMITANPAPEKASSLLSDTDSDPEERIKVVPEIPPLWIRWALFYEDCPRYDEIKSFLIANRAEQRLALDSMRVLPEATFFRYIRDFREISLTIREFKAFLSQCYLRRELFL